MRRFIRFVPVVVLLVGILTWWKIFHAGSPVGHWMHGYNIGSDGKQHWDGIYYLVYDGPGGGVIEQKTRHLVRPRWEVFVPDISTIEQGALFVLGPRYFEYRDNTGAVLHRSYFRVSGDTLYIYDMTQDNWYDNLRCCRVFRRLK
jgi:hypothetical protein